MENKSEYTEAKSPWRRSSRQPQTPGIQETSNLQSDPKTPTKQSEFSTPSKAEAMVVAPTPRRSARKSVKPIQEYENIVAQKGLKSATRSTGQGEDSTDEGKWIPAIIGRVSSKRGKKLIRGKSRSSKRQRRCTEESEASNADDCGDLMEIEDINTIVEEQAQTLPDAKNSGSHTEQVIENEVEHEQQKQVEPLNEEVDIDSEQMLLINDTAQSKKEEKLLNEKELRKDTEDMNVEENSLKILSDAGHENANSEIDSEKNNEDNKIEKVLLENDDFKDGLEEETIDNDKICIQTETEIEKSPKDEENVSSKSAGFTEADEQFDSEEGATKQGICQEFVGEVNDDYNRKSQRAKDLQIQNNENIMKEEECQENSDSPKLTGEGIECMLEDGKINEEAQQRQIEREDKSDEKFCLKKVTRQEAVETVDIEDHSIESGDVELLEIPITADDSPDILQTEVQSTLTDEPSNSRSLDASVYENGDDSDCIMLSLNESINTETSENVSQKTKLSKLNESSNSTDMPSLLVCSDDEESEAGEAGNKSCQIDHIQDISSKLNGTFDADQTPEKVTVNEETNTQVLRPSISHVPTPFKLKVPMVPDIIIEPEEDLQSEEPPIVVEESRDPRMKSSRKRSISVCEDRPKRNVTFYSPANVTVSIYDGDLIDSCRKDDASKKDNHRKRSLSVTETTKEMITYIKQKKAPDTPDCKKKQHQPSSRTKMPNFTAIHQQQFRRMESISDHVARKAERAKVLSNSALKAKPASKEKGISLKNTVLKDSNKDAKANLAMPKARQRIELSGIEHNPKKAEQTGWLNVGAKIRSKSRNDLSCLDDLPSIDKIFKFNSSNFAFSGSSKPKLPKPRVETTVNKPNKSQAVPLPPTATTGVTVKDPRPKFNLSTAPASQSFRSTETLDDRRKRLIDMYKSRNQPRAVEKNREILKGVRTNRRFELQMMSRNRPN